MKKVLAILLAALMLLTIVPFAAFAKVEKNDAIITEIKNASAYKHIKYVKDKNEFKADRIAMGVFATYDDAWVNAFTDNVDVKYAEGVLLSIIDKIEAEYNNETFEKVLKVLEGANTVAGVVEKIDGFTGVLGLAENSTWGGVIQGLGLVINAGNTANEAYKTYVEAIARVLSIQASSIYYGEFLDYIIAHVDGDHEDTIKEAARNIKAQITTNLDDARDAIIASLAANIGKEGAYTAISVAMKTNTVTAVIDTVYNLSGTIGKKVFNSQNLYEYMTSLAEVVEIEDCVPAFVSAAEARSLMPAFKADSAADEEAQEEADNLAWQFAINALLTLRETGETLLKKLADTKSSSIFNKVGSLIHLWSNTDEMNALIKDGAIACAKLNAFRKLLAADATVRTYGVWVSTEKGKNAIVYNSNNQIVGKIISETQTSSIDTDKGVALFAENDTDFGSYIKVIVPLTEGLFATYPNYTVGSGSSSGSGSSGGSSKGGIGSIFSNLFKSLGDFFRNLFSIFKF